MRFARKSLKFLIRCSLAAGLLPWAILACLALCTAAKADAPRREQKKVLVLYASRSDSPYTALTENAFRKTLSDGFGERLDYYTEYVDLARFSSPEYQEVLQEFLRQKYAGVRLDVIIAQGNAPLEFTARHGAQIFPGVPLVFSTEETDLRPIPNSTGLLFQIDMRSTLDLSLQLQPNIKRVFVITGTSEFDKFYEKIARQQFQEFEGRISFTYLQPMPLKKLLDEASRLPKDSIIYFVSLFEDGAGEKFIPVDILDKLSALASVPVYCWPEMTIDHGIVGGNLLSEEKIAQQTAELALRVLRGENPDRIPIAKIRPYIKEFDWRQLRRWGIREDALPLGSVVRFKELTFWENYRWQIIGVIALLLFEAFMIFALLVQRARRGRAEEGLRLSEEKFSKAFRSSPDVLAMVRRSDGVILEINDLSARVLGYSRVELVGRTTLELHLYANLEDRQRFFKLVEENGYVHDFETSFRSKTGELLRVSLSAERITINKEPCLIIITRNITQRKRAEEELQRLTGRLIHLQDEERRRIAAELHDSLGQSLVVIKNRAMMSMQLPGDTDRIMEQLEEISETATDAIDQVHEIARNLRPYELDRLGLVKAVETMVAKLTNSSSIQFLAELDRVDGLLSPAAETSVYRIVQEALNNVIKHADATEARVSVKQVDKRLVISVADNGKGIKAHDGKDLDGGGFGLAGIAERARMLGGFSALESQLTGTTLIVTLGLSEVRSGNEA